MTEYPQDVMPLYAQGYSLAEFLIYRGGRRKFVAFLADGMRDGQWSAAVQRNYNISDLPSLQNTWVAWVAQGFPAPPAESNVTTVAAETPITAASAAAAEPRRPEPNLIYHIPDKASAKLSAAAGTQILGASESAPPVPPGQDMTPNAAPASLPQNSQVQVLPAQGWRTTDGRPAEGVQPSEATSSQVARPPTMEPSRQVILEWQQQ